MTMRQYAGLRTKFEAKASALRGSDIQLLPVSHWITDEEIADVHRMRVAANRFFRFQLEQDDPRFPAFFTGKCIDDSSAQYFLVLRHACAGFIGVKDLDSESASLDWVLSSPTNRQRGVISEALPLLIDWAFSDLAIQFLALEVLATNLRALDLYSGLGFGIAEEVMDRGPGLQRMKLPKGAWRLRAACLPPDSTGG